MKIVSLQFKLQIIIGIFSVILLAILGLVVYPAVLDIVLLQQEIDDTEAFLESQYQRSRRVAQRVTNVDDIVSSTAVFTDLTVSQGSELEIIKTLELLAKKYKIEQKITVSYSDPVDAVTKLPYYTFTFLNHGMMDDHLLYLDEILSQPYIVRIDSIDMTTRNTNMGNSKNTMSDTEVTLRFIATIYAK